MHNELLHAAQLFGFGILGVIVMALIKMNDINKMSEENTFGSVFKKFTKREWPSYSLASILILTAALTHDEWLPIFVEKVKGSYDITVGVKLFMVLFGSIGQYLVYKRLGKLYNEGKK